MAETVAALPPPPGGGVWPLVVVGAGAAGLTAAIFAGRHGVPALVLETRARPGAKIRVSGGGRCNVLPSVAGPEDFHTEGSRNALRNLLASWPLAQVRAFFEDDLGVALKVEETGKVFPVGDDAREVVSALLAEAARQGARLAAGHRLEALRPLDAAPSADGARFELRTAAGDTLRAARVVLATGGLSLPKTGSDGWGLSLAASLGHRLRPDYAALVPLLAADEAWGELAGLSLPVALRVERDGKLLEERTGDLLFTHRGFSGPVVLDLSRWLTAPYAGPVRLRARWIGRSRPDWESWLRQGGKRSLASALREELPRRLAARLLRLARVDGERQLAQLPRPERARLVEALTACPLEVTGSEGYRTAEVTGGGVPLDEVVTRTLESRLVPGLHLAGEVLDVTGRLGGFNFLWAWVSGRKAGEAAASGALQDASGGLV
jgi:predicted Rossmann fold flavoprotein